MKGYPADGMPEGQVEGKARTFECGRGFSGVSANVSPTMRILAQRSGNACIVCIPCWACCAGSEAGDSAMASFFGQVQSTAACGRVVYQR